jgi:hypothetical protein
VRGGRRYGAGRPGRKPKSDQLRHLDVRRLQRENLLADGLYYGWNWMDDDGTVTSSVSISTHDHGLTVSYRAGGTDVAQRVGLASTTCNYGGARPWFSCPHCGRRVALLYLSTQVACRQCFQLSYRSQSEAEGDRAARKQWKIDARLESGKRITARTRERLTDEMSRLEGVRLAALAESTRRLLARVERLLGDSK